MTISPKDLKVVTLAEKGGNDADLLLLDELHRLEDKVSNQVEDLSAEIQKIRDITPEWEKALQSIRGVDGEPGITPRRGIDYFTQEDVAKMVKTVLEQATPVKGKDYFDGKPGKDGRNPLRVSTIPPEHPQIGDLWYQP